jgi:hypothetical protein
MLHQPLAHIACGYAHNGIVTCVVRSRTPKKFNSNDTLFQGSEMASDRLVNDVLKKLPTTVASLKRGAFNDFLDVLLDQGDVFLSPCDSR